jgi:hypothetical protein
MTIASDLFYSSYASFYRLKNGWRPEKFIFILSHMRSGSTLLTHLLVSNPAICGYGETRTRYFTRRSFEILTGKVLYTLGDELLSSDKQYVLDKLLHDRFIGPDGAETLSGNDVRIIFLLREPLGTLSSLVRGLKHTESQALNYYVNRLATLHLYESTLKRTTNCLALTYDQVLHRTEDAFHLLERFLELDCSLMETYRILPTTGVQRIGDPSPKIFSGRIIRDDSQSKRANISAETLELAERGYLGCWSSLEDSCVHLDATRQADNRVQLKTR